MRDVIRTCIGCRQKLPQAALLRFTSQQEGGLYIDRERKLGGRGAYVCYSQDCVQRAFKAPKRINALLRVALASEAITAFEQELLQWIQDAGATTKKRRDSYAERPTTKAKTRQRTARGASRLW